MRLMCPMRLVVCGLASAGFVVALGAPAHADPAKCKAAIVKSSSQYVIARTKALVKCETAVVAAQLPPGTDCSNEPKTDTAIDKAKAKMEAAIAKACGGGDGNCGSGGDDDSLASIGWDVGACPDIESEGCTMPIGNCDDVSHCLECVTSDAVNHAVKLSYDDLTLPSADKTINKCQLTIGKAAAAFLSAKTKLLAKCWAGVNKGIMPGPCPDVGTAAAILAAENKKVAAICKACGGGDKGCDQDVHGPGGIVLGTGGSDDLSPTAIGFSTNCDDLTIPGGASCAQTVTTLADVVECVDCITEFNVDCTDRLAVPWGASYPGECNPGCGNGILEPGEICDGADSAACPGYCAPAILADGCTCPTGTFTLNGVAGADLDTGWTGIAHDQGALAGHLFDAYTYGCSSGGPDTECSFSAVYALPYFGPPLPLSSGGVPTCVVNEIAGPIAGTLSLTGGDLRYDYSLVAHVYSGISVAQPCPRCDGDLGFDDGVRSGTCTGGPSDGDACDANGVSASFGAMSFDCFPDATANIGNLAIRFDDATTGTKTVTTTADSPPCTSVIGPKCLCDTCNNASGSACASNADCPPSGGAPGICGGRRCLGGPNVGTACTVTSECPTSACARLGEPTRPSACTDDTSVPGDGTACVDVGGNEGRCPEGPMEYNCDAPEQFRGCTLATQASDCPITGTCLAHNRSCFEPTVTRVGTPGVAGGAYAGTFCISPTSAPAVNAVAGLPGLGTLVLPYSLTVAVP
jgi:hypothetical protein